MRSKTFMLALLAIAPILAHAQDKIYKTDGKIIEAKVAKVGTNTVTYKRYDYQTGPDYTIMKSDLVKITYENGSTDNFNSGGGFPEKKGKAVYKSAYGNNILSVIPGAYTASVDGTINDVGIGISYERLLDKKGHIAFTLPVLINFSNNKDFNSNIYNYSGSGSTTYGSYTSYTFMPGIKFYPASSKSRVRYALGGSLFTMFGSEPYAVYEGTNGGYYPGTGAAPTGDYRYAVYGLMLSNSVNISATKHFYMELDVNTGIPVADNRHADEDGLDNIVSPWIQFVLKTGYRF